MYFRIRTNVLFESFRHIGIRLWLLAPSAISYVYITMFMFTLMLYHYTLALFKGDVHILLDLEDLFQHLF